MKHKKITLTLNNNDTGGITMGDLQIRLLKLKSVYTSYLDIAEKYTTIILLSIYTIINSNF